MDRNRRPPEKYFPRRPALLIIDVQNYFVHEKGGAYLPMAAGIVDNINSLLTDFRGCGLPVAFTRHAHLSKRSAGLMGDWWSDIIIDGTWEAELFGPLDVGNDPVFVKERYSAFIGTGLEAWLIEHGSDGVVLAGVMTHLCVETTARDAFMRDYKVVVVEDACASDTAVHHEGALENLAHGFALIMNCRDVRGMAGG